MASGISFGEDFPAMICLPNAHPTFPSCGPWVGGDPKLDDDALLKSGTAWCNEQARILIRLCQVSGIPARIIPLFYSDTVTGHCIAKFYDDERCCMVCATRPCVFPDASGTLLSAAECHGSEEGRLAWAGQTTWVEAS